ncbi:uncharacterized protein LJ264_009619 [Porphyrio hochstetteri]
MQLRKQLKEQLVLSDCLKFSVVALNSTSQQWMGQKVQMFSKTTQKPGLALGRKPKKTNFSVKTVWRDYRSLPVMLQIEAQIEELKKEKMLYQKRGTLHFRHPFKGLILQSFLLEEAFTVDKKQKHYSLESKMLIDGVDETVHTLTLGYQNEKPSICAGLTHPYNYSWFPKDVELCVLTQSHQNVKHELETTLKVNKEDVFSFLGRHQDKSGEADFRHLLHMDVTHSFQLEFPQAVGLRGELFSRQTTLEHFDYSAIVKAIVNKNVSSQMTIQEVLTENEMEGALRLTYEQNTNFSFTISRKKDQQGEEWNIKALQTHPSFLQYFPSAAELSSKVNYDMSEAKGKLYLGMEKRDFNATAKLTFTGISYTHVIEIIQTVSQLKVLPRQLMLMTLYQKGNRTRMLRHIAVWDGKEIKVTGTYAGLFPKLLGGHDVQVEIFHPLSIPFPWHARVNLYVKHSARNHRDDLTVIWNKKDQVSLSSSLKFGKDRMNYRAMVAHPFNYTLKQLEVHSLSERRGRKYNQQLQLAGNGGQPAVIQLTLEDKSKLNITAWDGCMTLSSGQLQRVLSMEHLHACGSLERRSTSFNEYLDLNWDDKKFKHNLTYERNQFLYPDKFQLEAVLENIFLTSCTKQKILGKIETNYSSWLDYYVGLEFCDLPNVIVFSGKHQLNKDDIILESEGRFHLADHGRDKGFIGVSLKNRSTAAVKNYSLEIELKAFEDIWLGLTGTAASSSAQSQILVEGIIDQREKVKVAASKGKECFQYYMGYLKGDLEEGMEVSACTDGQQMATVNAYLNMNGERRENVGQMTVTAVNGSLSFLAHGCGDPILKAEYKFNEIGSILKTKLMEKIKKFDGYMWRFKRSVQQVDFLSEAAGWPSIALQKVSGFLHNVGRAVTRVWKQTGIRQILRSKLPLYLHKIQGVVQQMQSELQNPLATLKDAYYDVTLKPLDEVWQEKTEEYMKKIQAFLPRVVKDVWLMEPIQVALKFVKAGFDMRGGIAIPTNNVHVGLGSSNSNEEHKGFILIPIPINKVSNSLQACEAH